MSDPATAAYYRPLQQINQALIAQGATSISLIRLSWGRAKLPGSTATASEVWTTTFSDGTTAEFQRRKCLLGNPWHRADMHNKPTL
jgi:hypothetical protein